MLLAWWDVLFSVLRNMWEHDRFIFRVLTGFAGTLAIRLVVCAAVNAYSDSCEVCGVVDTSRCEEMGGWRTLIRAHEGAVRRDGREEPAASLWHQRDLHLHHAVTTTTSWADWRTSRPNLDFDLYWTRPCLLKSLLPHAWLRLEEKHELSGLMILDPCWIFTHKCSNAVNE